MRPPEPPSTTIRGRGAGGDGTRRRKNNRGSNWRSTLCRPRHCRECGLGFLIRTDPRKRRADWHFGADLDQHLLNPTGFENFDLDRTLLRLDNGDDIASLHMVSRLDRPFDQSARLHVGAERGHAEFRHGATC